MAKKNKKTKGKTTTMLDHPLVDAKKWMFFNCPKKHSWVVYQSIDDILNGTIYHDDKKNVIPAPTNQLTSNDINYIYSVDFTENRLVALLETSLNEFWLIHNVKTKETVNSNVFIFKSINNAIRCIPKRKKNLLHLKSHHLMKLTKEQLERKVFPYQYAGLNENEICDLLKTDISQGHLDLSWNFTVTSDILKSCNFTTDDMIEQITFNTCYKIRHFQWLNQDWVTNINRINFVNMSQITNENVEFTVKKLVNLKELFIHFCPQITIRIMNGFKNNNCLEVLCLDDPQMACQPNNYSGLLSEEEWESIRLYGLKKMLINSQNVSLDIIDYIRHSCPNLLSLIIAHEKYDNFKKNVLDGTDNGENKISIASVNGVKLDLYRNFSVRNLLKSKYEQPFSNMMTKVMEEVYKNEYENAKNDHETSDHETRDHVCSLHSCNK